SGMLMVGNRSTGMRARLVIPMTASARQMTMMKYGFRIEKRGIEILLRGGGPPAIHQQIRRRDNEDGQKDRRSETADDGAGQRCILLTPGSHLQGHRHHSDDGGKRRHQNRTQADAEGG